MFFSPVLHALLSAEGKTELWAACMTSGPPALKLTEAAEVKVEASSSLLNNFLSSDALPLRAQELLRAYAHFPGMGLDAAALEGSARAGAGAVAVTERVLIFSDPELQDGMTEQWDPRRVRDVLLKGMEERFSQPNVNGKMMEGKWNFDWLLTFDEGGISGHANHRALHDAAPLVADALETRSKAGAGVGAEAGIGERGKGRPQIWILPTLPLPLKYGSLPFAIVQRAASLLFFPHLDPSSSPSEDSSNGVKYSTGESSSSSSGIGVCLTFLSSPREYLVSLAAMRDGHTSQMLWFRYAWWGLSSYVFGGRICRVE